MKYFLLFLLITATLSVSGQKRYEVTIKNWNDSLTSTANLWFYVERLDKAVDSLSEIVLELNRRMDSLILVLNEVKGAIPFFQPHAPGDYIIYPPALVLDANDTVGPVHWRPYYRPTLTTAWEPMPMFQDGQNARNKVEILWLPVGPPK
jgi:hypothetical protein